MLYSLRQGENLQLFVSVLFVIAHSPDNTFLGFVVNAQPPLKTTTKSRREAKALVYGKHYKMWMVRELLICSGHLRVIS